MTESPRLRAGDEVVVRVLSGRSVVAYLRGTLVTTHHGEPDGASALERSDAVLVSYHPAGASTGARPGWVSLALVGRWDDNPRQWRIGSYVIRDHIEGDDDGR